MPQTPDPQTIIDFFEATDFDEPTKEVAHALLKDINRLLHNHAARCKASKVPMQQWLDSEKLALATALKMRVGIKA